VVHDDLQLVFVMKRNFTFFVSSRKILHWSNSTNN
jgi:hypothetical protein